MCLIGNNLYRNIQEGNDVWVGEFGLCLEGWGVTGGGGGVNRGRKVRVAE